jgi:acetylglutamate kinase
VGLTGADAGVAPVKKAPAHRATSGDLVDLGLVGEPVRTAAPELLTLLLARRFVPVIASIGAARGGQLFNVNADTLAASLAARVGATRLLIAGGTPGVLDEQGDTIEVLGPRDIKALVKAGTASAGMVAKLSACLAAVKGGVKEVAIVDGRQSKSLGQLLAVRSLGETPLAGTRVTP